MNTTMRAVAVCVTAIMIGSIGLVGCNKQDNAEQAKAGAGAAQQMPPTTVDVQVIELGALPNISTFSGRVTAAEVSEVRPQVSGIIDEILFQEGSMVQAGQPLYRINTDNYSSSVASAEAALNQAHANVGVAKAGVISRQATLDQAQADLARLKGLLEVEAISKQAHDQAVTNVKTARAGLDQARANLASAEATVRSAEAGLSASRLDLNRTIVRAPISGKTGISAVTKGALVAAGQATPLVTISRLNPVYVDINQSSSEILKLRQALASGTATQGSPEVQLVLEDGSPYPMTGQLMLSNAHVDEATGSVVVRAVLPNPQGLLIPGMYVNARLSQTMTDNAVLLPQSAVMRTPQGTTQVYIVNKDKKIEPREIKTAGTQDGKWLVTEGLKTGDRVVVMGGAKVKPEQAVEVRVLPPTTGEAGAMPPQGQPEETQESQEESAGQNSVLAKPVMLKPTQAPSQSPSADETPAEQDNQAPAESSTESPAESSDTAPAQAPNASSGDEAEAVAAAD